MSNFNILGVDISNNNSIKDLSTLKNNNVKYVYLKATEGQSFTDNTSPNRYDKCKDLGLKVGFYHFLVGTSSPEAQAENFYTYIKNYSSDLIPMLDVESNFNGLCDYVNRFISKFKELSNMKLGIYTYSGFLDNLNSISSQIADLPCWIANYRNDYEGVYTGFFNNIVGWQYSENGSIGSFTGDCNVFNEGCLLSKGEWLKGTAPGKEDKWWYKHSDGSYTTRDFELIDGEWYYFDYQGYMVTGWLHLTSNNCDYYFYSDGKMAHDCELWGTYRFDSNGYASKIE